jgi:hypothetical protein
MKKMQFVSASLARLACIIIMMGCPIGAPCAQDKPWSVPIHPWESWSSPPTAISPAKDNPGSAPFRPWAGKSSPATAAKFKHWRLKLEPGGPVDAPEKGAFPSFTSTRQDMTARLVSDLGPSAPIRLTPAMGRTRYVPPWDPRTDPKDKFVTKEIADILRSGCAVHCGGACQQSGIGRREKLCCRAGAGIRRRVADAEEERTCLVRKLAYRQ